MTEKIAVRTFYALLVTLVIYCLLWQTIAAHFILPTYYYARLIELLGIFLFASLALLIPLRFEEMGIAVPLPLLFRSLALGLGAALLIIALPSAAITLWRGMPLSAFFKAGTVARYTYFLVAPLQEVLAKSVMYYSFELCFERRHPHLANLLTALVFGLFHVVYGAPMMLLSMALSLATGWIFQKYRCVWGCAAMHFSIGFFYDCFAF